MICTGIQGQTALDFYLTLVTRTSTDQCMGPIAYLELARSVAERLMSAMEAVGKEDIIGNAYITRMVNSSNRALFGSCAAHWLDISSITSVIGAAAHRSDLVSIGRSLSLHVCEQLGWDYRELDNYMRSAIASKS